VEIHASNGHNSKTHVRELNFLGNAKGFCHDDQSKDEIEFNYDTAFHTRVTDVFRNGALKWL